ncbi:MAG: YihY/virulence factor BrkB family protein [Paludibacteraceae bacterium]|nr:YihY/virulence factor BrkB family protein [Paludibacteraceae bacterium]
MKERIQRIQEFIQYELWRHPHTAIQDPKKRLLYCVLQTILIVARGFKNKINIRANSLSFTLLFAFIPMTALVFAIARGFGFEEIIEEQLSVSFLKETNVIPAIMEIVNRYLETVQDGIFLGIGLIVLLWSVYAFFNMLELSFNSTWNVKQTRSIGRRLTNYIMTLLLVPMLIVLTSGISILINSTTLLAPILLRIIPWLAASAVFTWMYIAVPNTKVKLKAAIIPGVFLGILFMVVQKLGVYLVVLFTRMSIVYGAFSAIPLVLIWLHITCWLLLIGAELSFAIQNNEMFAYERDIDNMSRRYKDCVMLYLLAIIIKRFEKGEKPQTAQEMALQNQLPTKLVTLVLSRLEENNIILPVQTLEDIAFVPAMDTQKITVDMVIGKIYNKGTEGFLRQTTEEMQKFWQNYLNMIAANHSNDILVSKLASKE